MVSSAFAALKVVSPNANAAVADTSRRQNCPVLIPSSLMMCQFRSRTRIAPKGLIPVLGGQNLIDESLNPANCHPFGPIKDGKRPAGTFHLETAAFLFHMSGTTQGITGSLRAACSEPVQRFLACPFS